MKDIGNIIINRGDWSWSGMTNEVKLIELHSDL